MELTVATILVTFAGVFLICFMKGAFGGGSLNCRHSAVGDRDGPCHRRRPARAIVHRDGFVRAPLLEAHDVVEAGPCAAVAGAVTGIGLGYLLFRFLDHRAIAIAMAGSP